MLSEKEKEELLTIARRTLETFLKGAVLPSFDLISENLQKPGGAFVTLRRHKDLRGCIGRFDSPEPLYQVVQQMVLASALEDPRFQPVVMSEVADLKIEISVLSVRQTIHQLSEIIIGRHGLSVSKGFHRGVLLPQVAIENKWNREEFLTQVCLKAGLKPNAWEEGGLKLEVFTADVFGENG